jgi:hypothetical protein
MLCSAPELLHELEEAAHVASSQCLGEQLPACKEEASVAVVPSPPQSLSETDSLGTQCLNSGVAHSAVRITYLQGKQTPLREETAGCACRMFA